MTSSLPPDTSPEVTGFYRDVLRTMLEEQIPFAVAGAFAMREHTGIWRVTKDLDVVMQAADVPRALERFARGGYEARVKDPVWLAKVIHGDDFVDLIVATGNCVLVVDESWLERAIPCEVFGLPCKLLAVEEMIASKLPVWRRERFDGSDVAHLLRSCGRTLDWERLLFLLGDHWESLLVGLVFFAYVYPGRTDSVPKEIWTLLLDRFAARVAHPDSALPFRGSLVDPNMFAIDVHEWGERDLYREMCEQHPFLLHVPENTSSQGRKG